MKGHRLLGLVVAIVLAEETLFAQSVDTPAAHETNTAQSNPSTDEETAIADSTSTPQYVPALDGRGLVLLNGLQRLQVFYGGSFSSGWDSNLTGEPHGPSGGIFTLNPYIGVRGDDGKTSYVLQYQPTIAKDTSNAVSGDTFQRATVSIAGSANQRWRWNVNAEAAYGQDSLRLIAPVATVAIGDISGVAPSAAEYHSSSGTSTFAGGALGFSYLKSDRDSVSFALNNSYSRLSDVGGSTNIVQASVGYNSRLSAKLNLNTSGQFSESYGSIRCSSVAGTIGVAWQLAESTRLEIDGGPQVSSKACLSGQDFVFHGAFSTRLSGQSQLYAVASRQLGASYLGQGVWQDNVSVGYQRNLTRTSGLNLDFGYAHTDNSSTSSDHSLFADGTYSWAVQRGLIAALSCRYFTGNTGPGSLNGYAVMFSFTWSPDVRGLLK